MSLVAQAVCVIAQALIAGKTWAGDDVLLQPVDPIGEIMQDGGEEAPVVAVSAERTNFKVDGRATQGICTKVELKIFAYCAPGVLTKTLDDGSSIVEVSLDTEKAGLTLNVMARQIDAAFHAENGAWSAAWRKFVTKIEQREVRYVLIEIENGVKIPTAEIGFTVEAIPDPDFGGPVTVAWNLLFDALGATAEGEKLAGLFRALILTPSGIPDWKMFRDNFALTDAGMAATGLGPYAGVTMPDGSIPPLTSGTVSGQSGPIGNGP